MVTSIGDFFSVGGRNFVSGGQSGFNIANIVNGLVAAKTQALGLTTLNTDVADIDADIAKLGEYRTLISTLQSATQFLRGDAIPFSQKSLNNILETKLSFLTISDTTSQPNEFLGVTVTSAAKVGSYDLEIEALAKGDSKQTATGYTTQTGDLIALSELNAGTFKIESIFEDFASKTIQSETVDGYTVNGTATSFLTTGIHNIVVGSGDTNLQGVLTNITATVDGTDVDLTFTVNGSTYTGTVAANTGAGSDEIAAGTTMTLTNASTSTSFDLVLANAFTIGANQTNADSFASNLVTALDPQKIFQQRQLLNFDSNFSQSVFTSITSSDIVLESDGFNTTTGVAGEHGAFGKFTITPVTTAGAQDAKISVVINGETYEATGLGTAGDLINTDVTLTSTTSGSLKKLQLKFGTSSESFSVANSTSANNAAAELDSILRKRVDKVTTESTETLTELVGKINAFTTKNDVQAQIVKVSDTDFRLRIESTRTGSDSTVTIVDASNVFAGKSFSNITTAQNASVRFDSVVVSRKTNKITDLVDGVTFELFDLTPTGSPDSVITVDISRDTNNITSSILLLVDAYNAVVDFETAQTKRDAEGNPDPGATLIDNNLLKATFPSLENSLRKPISGLSSGALSSLEDIGITLDKNKTGKYITDSAKLLTKLASDFDQVADVFRVNFDSDAPDKLGVSETSSKLAISSFKLVVDTGLAEGQQAKITYNHPTTGASTTVNATYTATSSGGIITGPSGSAVEGLVLTYVGDGTDTINATVTQGFADKLFTLTEDITRAGGLTDKEIEVLNDKKDDLEAKIEKVNAQIATFQTQQLLIFSEMERALSQVNSSLQVLDSFANAQKLANS